MITIDRWFRSIARDGLIHGLCGVVMGHPHIEDGIRTRTSDLVAKIVSNKFEYVITKNGTIYRLLEAKPEYEAKFPYARKRLLERLPDADDLEPSIEDEVDISAVD